MLSNEQLMELTKFDTPTIANALESFGLMPRTEGFMGPEIKCILPCDKPMVGYAATAKMSATNPPTTAQKEMVYDYYAAVKKMPNPTFIVIEDVDPTPIGSFWGEVNASIHKALGCVGTITNGGVRDLDEVKKLGFGYFAGCVLVSHAYNHLEEFGTPVKVGGLTVHPGDLLHADKHGVIAIPKEIAPRLAEACRKAQYAEEPVLEACRESFETGIDLEKLKKSREEMLRRRSGK